MFVYIFPFILLFLHLCLADYCDFKPTLWDTDKDYYQGIRFDPDPSSKKTEKFLSVNYSWDYELAKKYMGNIALYESKRQQFLKLTERSDSSTYVGALVICLFCILPFAIKHPFDSRFLDAGIPIVVCIVIFVLHSFLFSKVQIKGIDFSKDLSLTALLPHFSESEYKKHKDIFLTEEETYPAFFYFVTEIRASWLDFYCAELKHRKKISKAIDVVLAIAYMLFIPVRI